jgi:hypothetical protein
VRAPVETRRGCFARYRRALAGLGQGPDTSAGRPGDSAEASLPRPQPPAAAFRFAKRLAESAAESTCAILRIIAEVPERSWCRKGRRTPGAAWRTVFRGIHPQLAAVEIEVVERRNRLLGFLVRRELDECESAGSTRFTIGADVNADHLSSGYECFAETILGRVEAQITDKNFPWNGRILPITLDRPPWLVPPFIAGW